VVAGRAAVLRWLIAEGEGGWFSDVVGELWVLKTCAIWADALQLAVASVPRSGVGEQVLVRREMG
jgi:hypothetical protein